MSAPAAAPAPDRDADDGAPPFADLDGAELVALATALAPARSAAWRARVREAIRALGEAADALDQMGRERPGRFNWDVIDAFAEAMEALRAAVADGMTGERGSA